MLAPQRSAHRAPRRRVLLLAALPVPPRATPNGGRVRFVRPDARNRLESGYTQRLLQAALQAAGGSWQIEHHDALSQHRALRELRDPDGVIDVYAMAPNPERENLLRVVPVPLYRGLFGWRLLLVRPERQARFQPWPAPARPPLLQGSDWPDTEILRANDWPVVSGGTLLHRLHQRLRAGEVDLFPRALPEAWREADAAPEALAVLPGVALHYRSDLFFFTRASNPALAEALERGLYALHRSGRLDEMLLQQHGEAIRRSQLGQRQLLRLNNPLLSPRLAGLAPAWWSLPA